MATGIVAQSSGSCSSTIKFLVGLTIDQSSQKHDTYMYPATRGIYMRHEAKTLLTTCIQTTVKPVFKTTRELGATRELRTATSVPRPIQYIEMDLRTDHLRIQESFSQSLGCP